MRTACATHSALITGSIPGMAASTSETCELGAPPNAVGAPEKSFACEVTWAWISMPMTTSHSPVAPAMSCEVLVGAFMAGPFFGPSHRAPRQPSQEVRLPVAPADGALCSRELARREKQGWRTA